MTMTPSPIRSPEAPLPVATLVVVDDDPSFLETLEQLLAAAGLAAEGFTDPVLALERLRRGPPPDLILLDCIMPRITGLELLEALGAAGVKAPVVMMTALSDPSFCVHLEQVSVLNKPFLIDDLLAEVDAVLRPRSGPRSVQRRLRA
jgi:two-component system response regulator MprA